MKGLKSSQELINRKGTMPFPKKLTIEPTFRCNLRCEMCERYSDKPYQKRDLSLQEIKRLIDELPTSIKSVYISGGEPLIREDIIDICKLFLNKDIPISITTNGTFPDKSLKIAKLNGVNLTFSLDGTRNVHNKIRGVDLTYDKVIDTLSTLKQDLQIEFGIMSVITDNNFDSIFDLIQNIRKEGLTPNIWIIEIIRRFTDEVINDSCRDLNLLPSDFPLRVKNNILPSYSYSEFKKNMVKINKELVKSNISRWYLPPHLMEKPRELYYRTLRSNNPLYCIYLERLRIDPEGNILLCPIIRKSFGNIHDKPISEIWNSKEFCDMRLKLTDNNLTSVCETCCYAVTSSFYKVSLTERKIRILNNLKSLLNPTI